MIADKQLTRMIEKGKPLSVIRKKVEALALAEDKAEFYEAQRVDYDVLFPINRVATDLEYEEEFPKVDGIEYSVTYPYFEDATRMFPMYMFAIDYSEDETYKTLQEYRDERTITTIGVEATYDAEGVELTAGVLEVSEPTRPYIASDVTDIVAAYVNRLYKELRAKEYPPIADYVDAVVKDDTEAIEAYIKACLAVKAKYPKV